MSRQLNLFGKPVVRKAGPYRSPSNRYEKFVNALRCLQSRSASGGGPAQKQTIRHGERRGMEKIGRVRSIVNYDKTYGIFLRGFANICAVSNSVIYDRELP